MLMVEKMKPGEPGDGKKHLLYYHLFLYDIMSQIINVC